MLFSSCISKNVEYNFGIYVFWQNAKLSRSTKIGIGKAQGE